jgi:pyruvate/2-oxoglutarate dehydrogenase complex dihydrolipoamide acyltransferase (E2) component
MNRMRLRIAERLKESQNAAASLTTFNEIDMSSLMEMRKKYKDEVLKEHDVKLGYMSAFARACSLALQEIPAANASIEGDEIVYRDYVDLSVAVATPKGLVTPVVRNAESMGFVTIEKEIAALGKKARDGKLTMEDMAGGTFTMCVLLSLSILYFLLTKNACHPARTEAYLARSTAPRSSTCPSPRCWACTQSRTGPSSSTARSSSAPSWSSL